MIITAFVRIKTIETVTTTWGGNAEMVYDIRFMHMLMKHPDNEVCLFNMDSIQNDVPFAEFDE